MNKSVVLAKLEEYKDRPIELGLLDVKSVYGNIKGHWLFDGGDCLIHVEKNVSNASYEIPSLTQREKSFIMTAIYYDDISYIKTFISPGAGEIEKDLGSFNPIGTDKSKDDVIKELQGDSIHKVVAPRSFQNVDDVAPNSSYGTFKGSAISTSIDGLPEYYNKLVE